MTDQALIFQTNSKARFISQRLDELAQTSHDFRLSTIEILTTARDLLGNGFGPEGVIGQAMINLGYALRLTPELDAFTVRHHYEEYQIITELEGSLNILADHNIAVRSKEARLQGRIKALTQLIDVVTATLG